MDVPAKLTMARALDALGVDIIEAGFPIASPADSDAVRAGRARSSGGPVIAALARCRRSTSKKRRGRSKPAERSRIHTFLATSDLHLDRQAAHDPRRVPVDRGRTASSWRGAITDDVEFSAEDATRSDRDFLCRVIEAVIAAGCTTVNLPDTVGYATPDEMREFFADIIARVPNADRAVFSAHCHDDLGLAVANSLAAIQGGVRQVECTINGIGERAGNASLEEFVMALRVRPDRLPYDTGVQSARAVRNQPAALDADQRTGPGQQGDRRAQRLRARGRHPPGRRAEGRTDLRNHEAGGRRTVDLVPAGARPALGPARRAAPLRRARSRRSPASRSTRSIAPSSRLGEHRKAIADGDLRRIVDRVRTPAPAGATAAQGHVEAVGYGHGV